MILIRFNPDGLKRTTDLRDVFRQKTALLVGGSPSLKEQDIRLLEGRGVLTMAMNNAAVHFRPTLWVSGDRPDCYEPQILEDPTIMKFAPLAAAEIEVNGKKYHRCPNTFFYIQKAGVPWEEYLVDKAEVPWYNNTLFVAIHILYQLGVRRIVLCGSDFGFGAGGEMYAHETRFGNLEKKWNLDLYNHLVKELRALKPTFEQHGLELLDSSKNSRVRDTYRHVSLEEAVALCREGFPEQMKDPAELPHCSKFAPMDIKKAIAGWPGYSEGGTSAGGEGLQDVL